MSHNRDRSLLSIIACSVQFYRRGVEDELHELGDELCFPVRPLSCSSTKADKRHAVHVSSTRPSPSEERLGVSTLPWRSGKVLQSSHKSHIAITAWV